ncbi:hypothetical protein LCGC14_0481230 [marine sediment metagenome]|uniref:Uncharacterized protein n=1 Tax=marine sediment metagenome TaxID=412755 RepID=A0A0F9VI57_9ZZZZ
MRSPTPWETREEAYTIITDAHGLDILALIYPAGSEQALNLANTQTIISAVNNRDAKNAIVADLVNSCEGAIAVMAETSYRHSRHQADSKHSQRVISDLGEGIKFLSMAISRAEAGII